MTPTQLSLFNENEGTVYFAWDHRRHAFKIGSTRRPVIERVNEQPGLTLVSAGPGGFSAELHYHARLDALRYPGRFDRFHGDDPRIWVVALSQPYVAPWLTRYFDTVKHGATHAPKAYAATPQAI